MATGVKSTVVKSLMVAATFFNSLPGDSFMAAADYGRIDLAEVCCVSDSRLTSTVLRKGGTAKRYSNWNGFDFTTTVGATKLTNQLHVDRPKHVWFSPPCGPDSQIHNLSPVTEELTRKRARNRRIQRNVKSVIDWLLRQGWCKVYL